MPLLYRGRYKRAEEQNVRPAPVGRPLSPSIATRGVIGRPVSAEIEVHGIPHHRHLERCRPRARKALRAVRCFSGTVQGSRVQHRAPHRFPASRAVAFFAAGSRTKGSRVCQTSRQMRPAPFINAMRMAQRAVRAGPAFCGKIPACPSSAAGARSGGKSIAISRRRRRQQVFPEPEPRRCCPYHSDFPADAEC